MSTKIEDGGPDVVTDAMIDRALHAHVPGGSEVWAWLPQKDAFTPHQIARDVMRSALGAVVAMTAQPVQVACPACCGQGLMSGYDCDCPSCHGTGKACLAGLLRDRAEIERRGASISADQPISDLLDAAADAISKSGGAS